MRAIFIERKYYVVGRDIFFKYLLIFFEEECIKKQDVKVVVCSMLLRSKFKYVSDFMFTLHTATQLYEKQKRFT